MKLVVIESPYSGDVERNLKYARAALRNSIDRGEAPFASHLLYTQPGVLDDNDPEHRELGIGLGYDWWHAAELIAFYTDYGWSRGMLRALRTTIGIKKPFRLRSLFDHPKLPPMTGDENINLIRRSVEPQGYNK